MSAGRRRAAARGARPARPPRPWAVFLDRDGTLLRLVPYLRDPERARLYRDTVAALRLLRAAGARLVVVTNQAGVARGLMTRADVARVNRRLMALLAVEGVWLDSIEVCPHHPDFTGPCRCRKPAPGLLTRAARRLGLDLSRSWMVGDAPGDLEAGEAAGARTALVRTGYGKGTARRPAGRRAAVRGASLLAVARGILRAG